MTENEDKTRQNGRMPAPEAKPGRRMMVVLAHPDDESFGMGGTLAKYAAEGVEVHIVIATDGVAGSVAEGYEHTLADLVAVRMVELQAAVDVLGGQLHTLGYRDSGYIGDPANEHPDAFIQQDEADVVGRLVALIREIQPQVVVSHDETGGYYHPDHIMCWKVTTPAFFAAGDPEQYPDTLYPAYQPARLYYSAISSRMIKVFTGLMRLRGQDPKRMGRNKDIDFTRIGIPPQKVHTRINYVQYWDVKREASSKHPSQGGGRGGRAGMMPDWMARRLMGTETYIRAYPPVPDGYRESDMFEGLGE